PRCRAGTAGHGRRCGGRVSSLRATAGSRGGGLHGGLLSVAACLPLAVSDLLRVLGVETSCGETWAGGVEGNGGVVRQRSLGMLSQDIHRVFGGVVPEIASRQHLTALVPVVERALADAHLDLSELDAVAVTHAPGLVGALLVGVCYAKALAHAAGKPVVAVHHME